MIAIPRKVESVFRKFSFMPDSWNDAGYCSMVYFQDDRVLKIPLLGEELLTGIQTSRWLEKHGGPSVIATDAATGSVLMERITPGTLLSASGLDDRSCFEIIAGITRRWRGESDAAWADLVTLTGCGDALTTWLYETTRDRVCLHADLHHDNVLFDGIEWRPIDAKGLMGDPAFEAAGFIRNPIPFIGTWPDLEQILKQRIEWWSDELRVDPVRIWAWTLVSVRENGIDESSPWWNVQKALEAIWPRELEHLRATLRRDA